eukprot:Nitzschia sp. Nitz4//scaffold98_size77359//60977//61803//NITZ4_005556-RA/size77359-processed-gene-0.21-mRNA-1//1//CDS//3329560781//3187//frame0
MFTIVFILLGASVVGGALALFIQDVMEGLVNPSAGEYQTLLERTVFDMADIDQTGVLSYQQFGTLIRSTVPNISDEVIHKLWIKFDNMKDGVIHFEEFAGRFRGIDRHVQAARRGTKISTLHSWMEGLLGWLREAWQLENRIYVAFVLWLVLGVSWGMKDQGWDLVTATHFAVSALATGGLTAPPVDKNGTLPASAAIFCGVYCLFGIPLFALTLGHFARVLRFHCPSATPAGEDLN